jgi:hypothetical protein
MRIVELRKPILSPIQAQTPNICTSRSEINLSITQREIQNYFNILEPMAQFTQFLG